jgi:hypothetical protein
LEAELKKVTAAIQTIYQVLTPETKDLAQQQIKEYSARKKAIEQRLATVSGGAAAGPLDIEEAVESLIVRLADLANELENLPPHQLRKVLAMLTDSLTADMLTREVKMSLRIPLPPFLTSKRSFLIWAWSTVRGPQLRGRHKTPPPSWRRSAVNMSR